MTGQELLEMLISWIENKGYIVKNVNLDGGIANISSLYKLCAIDFSVATAFWICHEFVHAKYEDKRVCENDSMSQSEKRANKEAFWILWDIFEEHGGRKNDLSLFCEISGCSFEYAELQLGKRDSEVIEELNTINAIENRGSRSLERCLDDFMAECVYDEPVSIDRFLAHFGFPSNMYNRVEILVRKKMDCPVIFPYRFF